MGQYGRSRAGTFSGFGPERVRRRSMRSRRIRRVAVSTARPTAREETSAHVKKYRGLMWRARSRCASPSPGLLAASSVRRGADTKRVARPRFQRGKRARLAPKARRERLRWICSERSFLFPSGAVRHRDHRGRAARAPGRAGGDFVLMLRGSPHTVGGADFHPSPKTADTTTAPPANSFTLRRALVAPQHH